ncbi:MAG: peptidylprolyl isomerase [Ignavibacteria bacterium]|nr:peptidylprolyl isomerase [Ignavibacteria bacterium]
MKRMLILSILLFTTSFLHSQEVLDRIVALVDDEIILQSELDFQAQLIAYQRRLSNIDNNLKRDLLNAMIEQKLILAQAAIDSISVSEEEVTRQLDYQINVFIQQYGSKEKLEQTYGMPLEKIKRELRDEVKKNILIQKVQEQKFGKMEISRFEVEEFYKLYQDSLGTVPEEYKLSQIFITPKLSEEDKITFRNKAQAILDSLKQGASFVEMAKKYSEDLATARDGGDLGFVKRGLFYKEFDEIVFTLKEGEISPVIETPTGFHIAQLIERRGEAVRVRHILIKIQKPKSIDESVIQKLKSIKDSIINGYGSFSEFASRYSEDKTSAQFGGDMGIFSKDELEENIQDVVSKLKEGEISEPNKVVLSSTNYGYQIIWLDKKIPEHKINLKQDYDKLAQLALLRKKQNVYNDWISQIKKQIYWEIRL